jgi:hypothetical protein
MSWIMVPNMSTPPYCCIACGSTPRDESGNHKASAMASAVDVKWGDSVYICESCGHVLAELFGYVSPDKVHELKDRIEELEDVQEEHEALKARVERMLSGAKARREVKANAN